MKQLNDTLMILSQLLIISDRQNNQDKKQILKTHIQWDKLT